MNYNKLDQLVKENKPTLGNLCKVIKISPQGFGKMIKTKSTKVSTLELIANFYKVPISYFFDEGSKTDVQIINDPLIKYPDLNCPECILRERELEAKNKLIKCLETQLNDKKGGAKLGGVVKPKYGTKKVINE